MSSAPGWLFSARSRRSRAFLLLVLAQRLPCALGAPGALTMLAPGFRPHLLEFRGSSRLGGLVFLEKVPSNALSCSGEHLGSC